MLKELLLIDWFKPFYLLTEKLIVISQPVFIRDYFVVKGATFQLIQLFFGEHQRQILNIFRKELGNLPMHQIFAIHMADNEHCKWYYLLLIWCDIFQFLYFPTHWCLLGVSESNHNTIWYKDYFLTFPDKFNGQKLILLVIFQVWNFSFVFSYKFHNLINSVWLCCFILLSWKKS